MQELRTTRRDEILRVAANRGARNIRGFGSVARGDNDARSDIDFLVDLEPDRSLFDLSGLLIDLEAVLQTQVDVVTERACAPASGRGFFGRRRPCEGRSRAAPGCSRGHC